jgi:microcystin-dependent protein
MAISFDSKKNFAFSLVATAPSPAISGTSLVVTGGEGVLFPAVPFNSVIWPVGVQPSAANAEVVRVTNISTDTFTITRAQESSSARTVLAGDQIALNVTAKTLTDIQTAIYTASAISTPIGTIAMWLTGSPPNGWTLMQGQQNLSRVGYPDLFSLWGTTYGVGDGSTTFGIPDFRQRIPIGQISGGALATLATLTGSWDHTHGPGTLAVTSHTHGAGTLTVASHTHDSGTLTVASHTHGAGSLSVDPHTHFFEGTTDVNSVTGVTVTTGGDVDMIPDHDHDFSGTTESASPALSGTTASAAPAINGGNTGSTAPVINGGVTGATAPTVGSGVSGTGNPPVIVVNFIVRSTNEV